MAVAMVMSVCVAMSVAFKRTALFFSLWVWELDMLDVFPLGDPLDWLLAKLLQVFQLACVWLFLCLLGSQVIVNFVQIGIHVLRSSSETCIF